MSEWFLLEDKNPLPPAENMARDEYLFHLCAGRSCGFIRFYSWKKPTFSIGVSQKVKKVVNLDFLRKNQLGLVRRMTGGKTVLHNHELTYTVVSSENFFFRDNDLYQSYKLIAQILVDAFRELNIPAVLSKGNTGSISRSDNPCFSFPTPNEIEVNGKKIVGSAQKRNQNALLQHGSIPLSMDYEMYAAGTRSRESVIARYMTTLEEISAASEQDLKAAIVRSFCGFTGTELKSFQIKDKDNCLINQLKEKYASHQWNFAD